MSDFIKVNPPPTQSTISGLVIPHEDGQFLVTVTAYAEGNNQGTPMIWGLVQCNNQNLHETDEIAWQDGLHHIVFDGVFDGKRGETYRIEGISGNRHAKATAIKMSISRV